MPYCARMMVVLFLLSSCATPGPAPRASIDAPRAPIEIQWLGHAAFQVVSSGGTKLLIDPFLTDNPATPSQWKDLVRAAIGHDPRVRFMKPGEVARF